jgi:hypothetical protein
MIYFDKDKQAFGDKIENYICMITDELWSKYAGTDKWDIINGVFTDITDTEEYKKKKEQEEKERISHLKCTKRVLALILQQMGVSYAQLKNLIATNEQAQLEWELCVELERSNPLLDIMGKQLGITPEQLDIMFKYANGEVDKLN